MIDSEIVRMMYIRVYDGWAIGIVTWFMGWGIGSLFGIVTKFTRGAGVPG